jgi:hypothetical protein
VQNLNLFINQKKLKIKRFSLERCTDHILLLNGLLGDSEELKFERWDLNAILENCSSCLTGRQGGRRKIMSIPVKERKNKSWKMLPGVGPEKDYLAPEVKAHNEITCDYEWDKLYPPPFLQPALNGIQGRPPLLSGLRFWT